MKRIMAIHDLSGFGKCSLTIVIPVLSAMGISCNPLTTAILSSHTGFEDFTFLDLTEYIKPTLEHWKKIGAKFDMIYSGFLGSAKQMELVQYASNLFPEAKLLVDPVMGDHGKTYKTYTTEMCYNMARLTKNADIITPNVTEAAILLNQTYESAPRNQTQATEWLKKLGENKTVVITGLRFSSNEIATGWKDSTDSGYVATPYVGGEFNGTGDLFSTVLSGSLLKGLSLEKSIQKAAEFVYICAKKTEPSIEGICFESSISELL